MNQGTVSAWYDGVLVQNYLGHVLAMDAFQLIKSLKAATI